MCRRCQRGQAETKGETQETEPVAPKSRQPVVGLPAGRACTEVTGLASQGNGRVGGGGWGGGGGIRVTSGSITLNKD